MNIEPKTTKGKIFAIFLAFLIAVVPTTIVLMSGVAKFEISAISIAVIIFMVLVIVAISLSLFGFDITFTSKEQDERFLKKLEPFWKVFEKIQNVLFILLLAAIVYLFLKTKYGM